MRARAPALPALPASLFGQGPRNAARKSEIGATRNFLCACENGRLSFPDSDESIQNRIQLALTKGLPLIMNKGPSKLLLGLLVLLIVSGTTAGARSRRPPLRFEVKVVDSATGKPRSRFFLGERVSLVFALTNQSNVARETTELSDTSIPVELTSLFDYEEPETIKGSFGGTGGSHVGSDGTIYWTDREARRITLAPGQTVSVKINDLGRAFARRLQDGKHILTATYKSRLKAAISFRIIIDEAKSVPLLEQLATTPVFNGDDSDRIWANVYLRQIRQPSISGRIVDAKGKPLKEVWIDISGTQKTNIETRSNGRYHLTHLMKGGTYTLTPKIYQDDDDNAIYKVTPSSITIANVKSHVTGVNFTVTRGRP
jgi:hypothetical protein